MAEADGARAYGDSAGNVFAGAAGVEPGVDPSLCDDSQNESGDNVGGGKVMIELKNAASVHHHSGRNDRKGRRCQSFAV